MKRIAVLTGGGDAPGLNAVIRAVVKTAINEYGCEVLGVRDGYDGFLSEGGISPLDTKAVRGILPRGGTILGTANRGNPFARKVMRDGKEVVVDISGELVDAIKDLGLDAVIVIGGDGTLRVSMELFDKGVPVVGVPKTIDNDIVETTNCFGFSTAVEFATDAIDRLHSTAEEILLGEIAVCERLPGLLWGRGDVDDKHARRLLGHHSFSNEAQISSLSLRANTCRLAYAGGGHATFLPA